MAIPARPLCEINEQAIRVLVRELGAADSVRFIRQFTTGFGDYTEERKELFKDVSIEKVVEEIQSRDARPRDERQ